ncbi:STAS domain-containing protein [Hydrogenophaga sp. PAMC20947]|uniref:STAS domain-containing protein n=1 Tax=Hydrogenophaga sp. PAMC20947 TaxID=2565558 RepID=UPI00109DEA78|nr:STAS domain-containing protein [Hydrogenophaga sp. PAMC20947]QCB46727.1 STAS domain-containing protein [Hydrogenophaga sp. PAMC20947]
MAAVDTSDSFVRLPERVTLQEAVQVLDELNQALAKLPGAQVTLDASGLQVFDTSAVAVLLTLRSNLLAQGKKLSVDGWPQRLADLVKLYGVSELLAA